MLFRLIHQHVYLIVTIFLFSCPASTALAQGHAPWVGETFSGILCQGNKGGYGPYDYLQRHQYKPNLDIVEGAHFTPNVENLISGNEGPLEAELDYTLRAWPNHHRALNSVIRIRVRSKGYRQDTRYPPAECYLKRAINYSPKDAMAYMLYGILLARLDKLDEALDAYQAAEKLEPNNLQVKYNTGLLLFELGRYDDAQTYALEVYSNNFPLPGLKRKLDEKGLWDQGAN